MSDQAITMYKEREDIIPFLIRQYDQWKTGRACIEKEWVDTQNMIFATDAAQSVGVEASSSWKNNSTRGKLAQIRDNLHANYASAIFGNRNWIKWETSSNTEDFNNKRKIVTAYMRNKIDQSNFEKTVSDLLYDYIDYGTAFASCEWITRTQDVTNRDTGISVNTVQYVGPVAVRHSPHDVVINPTARKIENTPQFVRSLVTLGELLAMQDEMLHDEAFQRSLSSMVGARKYVAGVSADDFHKECSYQVQGFGSYHQYMESGTVELLTYYGNIVTPAGKLEKNKRIVIADRAVVLFNDMHDPLPSGSFIKMAGWRDRPDNLYSQSPLAKLIGLQFRVDKLENIKADAMDLAVEPPLVVTGEVSDFTWRPGEIIDVDLDGSLTELGKNLNGLLTAQNEIYALEQAMEEFAGAPKQAMGFRTPGEKTAFEVQSLETAGSRIFQQKVMKFEQEILEPLINDMLNLARVNLVGIESIKIIDPDLNLEDFINITSDDLIANGTLKAIGSRHFISKAQTIQEINMLTSSGIMPLIQAHVSGKQLAFLVNDLLELDKYDIFRPMVGVEETADIQNHAASLQEEMAMSQGESTEFQPGDEAAIGDVTNVS